MLRTFEYFVMKLFCMIWAKVLIIRLKRSKNSQQLWNWSLTIEDNIYDLFTLPFWFLLWLKGSWKIILYSSYIPLKKTSDATRNHLQRKKIVTYFSSCRTNPFHYLVAKDEFDQLGIDLQSLKTTEVCRKGKTE